MPVTIIRDVMFSEHDPGRGHPECPERLASIDRALGDAPLDRIELEARPATPDELAGVHTDRYLRRLLELRGRSASLGPDTRISPASVDASLRGAGAAIDLATAVATGRHPPGMALVRPPGHHATPERAMGFCLINNIAVAARALIATGVAERIAIYDFDVHHGNGTQDAFEVDADVLYMSTHQHPFYPGTGAEDVRGRRQGEGTTLNVPLPGGTDDERLLEVTDRILAPAVAQFSPDMILLSAGFDAYHADPVGGFAITQAGFRAIAQRWLHIAQTHTEGRIAAVLEGGYDLEGLGDCVVGFLDEWS